MNVSTAVSKRITALCAERKIAINALATLSGVPPMTVYSILNGKSKAPTIVNIKKICDGLEIGLKDFFDAPVFDSLNQEIE
ncbi:MAG: helix-turn-helix transcriptional regulator [Oscillospiraceae bacterium]